MSDKPEDNYIDQLFRDSVNNTETEPSDQFWNKAYETILQNENKVYQTKIRLWRGVSIGLGAAVLALLMFNLYTNKKVDFIEQKIVGLEKNQTPIATSTNQTISVATPNTIQPVSNSPTTIAANGVSAVNTSVTKHATSLNYGRHTNSISAAAMAFNNINVQHSKARNNRYSGQAYNSIYLDDRSSPITIPAEDKTDSNMLAMDDEDNSSVGIRHIDEEEDIPAPPKPKFGPRVSLSVYGAYSIAAPVIKDNNAADNITAADIKSREQQEGAFMFGANAGYDVSTKLSVQVGCEYRSYKFSLAPTTVNVNTGEWSSGYSFVTSSGTVYMPYIPGYSPKGYDTVATAKGSAVRTYVSIPISIKYKVFSDPKVGLYLRAGTSLNILACNYATVHCQNSLGEEDVYLYDIQGAKEVNFSYILGAGAVCRLCRGVDLYVEPSYSGAITPNTSSSTITTYSSYFDLTGGLTYHF